MAILAPVPAGATTNDGIAVQFAPRCNKERHVAPQSLISSIT
jgi:hypothetical protein